MAGEGDAYGATVAKRRLSRRLAVLRDAAGYTAGQACDKVGWGRGKVGRFEKNDWIRPEYSDIRDLARIYGLSEAEQADLVALTEHARQRAWWRAYPELFVNEFPGYEGDASRVSVYLPLVLPGLLQTPAYIEAFTSAGSRPPAWRERELEARLRRQRILDRADGTAPRLNVVITEASLMYRWASQADRRAQAAHLVEMGRRPNVELRLLPFAAGPHPGMLSSITIFDFPDDEDPSVVYLENDATTMEVTKKDEVQSYTTIFGQIRDAALAPAATTTHLEQLAKTLA